MPFHKLHIYKRHINGTSAGARGVGRRRLINGVDDMSGPVEEYRDWGRGGAQCVGRVLVLQHGQNPSTDIYLRRRLSAPGMPPSTIVDIGRERPADHLPGPAADGSRVFVIVCRYITGDWLGALERARDGLVGLAYFTDDDLPAMMADKSLPPSYRFRIWRRYGRFRRRLSTLADEIWVSTAALAQRYEGERVRLVPPLFLPAPRLVRSRTDSVRLFYHGTEAHRREIAWLAGVIAEVQRRRGDTRFEVFGRGAVARLYRDTGRVTVRRPLAWPAFFDHSARQQDIGLAPLFASAVNAARAPVKFFDITRVGAVGLYSDTAPYSGFLRDGMDGLLLPDDPAAWADAIVALAGDPERRRRLAAAAKARCEAINRAAEPLPGFEARAGAASPDGELEGAA